MANGIDFVIGGKDQAKPAMSSVEKSLGRLETGTNRLKSATQGLMASMGPLLAVFAAVKGAMAVVGSIGDANDAYDKQTAAVKGLEVALRMQGAAVDTESTRLQTFAGDMQKLTGVGDEVTIGLMKQASMLGVSTEQLDDAAKAAIGLSEATGKSLDESLKLVKNSLEGEFGAFGEIIPAIKTMATEEEKLAAVLALSQRGLEAKAEASNTVAGMSERAAGAVGDLMESVGALLAPVRILISAGIKTLAESLQTLLVPAVAYAEEVLANIGPLMEWVKEKVVQAINGIIAAFTFFEVILTNLDSVWTIVVASAELAMLQISGAVMHALTEVIPGYAAWFGENFVNLIRDGLNLAYVVTTNRIRNIIDAFQALWDFIASGGSSDILGQLGEIAGRSYLEGFESSLTALPDIAARTITDREKDLAETIGQVGANLGDEFSKKFGERMIGMGDGLSDGFSKDIDLSMNGGKNANGIAKRNDGTFGQTLNATESRLLTRGPGSSIPDLMKQILGVLDKIEKKNPVRFVPNL
tara:strand:- start:1565 stop:3145 length:1581 start_codon:yes stop_codon:yes gene_type:complete